MRRSVQFVVLLVAGASLCTACGYALAGRGSFLPESIKVIGIPDFANNTSFFRVEQTLTAKVRSEFIGRGKYKVIPDVTGADAVLKGELVSITVTPALFNSAQQATRYVISVTAKIEFRDVHADKVLWQNPAMVFREDYDVATGGATVTDPATFFGQDVNALERVASDFARSVVSAILEAF